MKRRVGLVLSIVMSVGLIASGEAANWLMLQGTEPGDQTQKLWGFAQPAFTADFGDDLSGLQGIGAVNNDKRVAQNSVGPWFNDTERVHVRRARVGLRGRFSGVFETSFTRKMNFFVLAEGGSNLITSRPFGNRARIIALTDLSLTFNQIPGARVRIGLFKTPGPEESFQGIHTFDYIEFTDFIARVMLERFTNGNLSSAPPAGPPTAFTTIGTPDTSAYGISAFRDWGIQIFDSVNKGNWDLSYATMIGKGDAIDKLKFDENFSTYVYASAEYDLPGGKGSKKNGFKIYAWHQFGERTFSSDPQRRDFELIRYGVGFKFLGRVLGIGDRHRFAADLMFADGMIFFAPLGGVAGNPLRIAAEKGNKARGFTLDYGFYADKIWQFDIRYARNDLLYDQAGPWTSQHERIIQAITFGVNYSFTPLIRLTMNYTLRDVDAPNPSTIFSPAANAMITNNQNQTAGSVGNRFALQLTWIFSAQSLSQSLAELPNKLW